MLAEGFMTNDDVVMSMIVSGKGGVARGDPHMLYSSLAVGHALRALYERFQGIPWYGLYLVASLSLGTAATIWALARLGSKSETGTDTTLAAPKRYPARHAVVAVLLLVFVPHAVVSLQFTVVSALLTMGGVLSVLSLALRRPTARPRRAAGTFLSCALIVAGSLVRPHSAWLVLLVMGPAVLWLVACRGAGNPRPAFRGLGGGAPERLGTAIMRSPRLWQTASVLGIAGLVTLASDWANAAAYRREPGWAGFYQYNGLFAQFSNARNIDYTAATRPLFDAVGFTDNDYFMLVNFFCEHPIFRPEALLHIVRGSPPRPVPPVVKSELARLVKLLFSTPSGLAALWVVALLALRRDRRVLAPLLALLSALGLLVALAYIYRPSPERVTRPVCAAVAFVGAAALAADRERASPHRVSRVAAVLTIAGLPLVFFSLGEVRAISKANDALFVAARRDMAALAPKPADLYAVWGASLPYQAFFPPLASAPPEMVNMRILPLSFLSRTPIAKARMGEFGIDNPALALATRDDVFLIARPPQPELMRFFLAQHENLDVRLQSVFRGETFTVYRVRRR